MRLRWLRSNDWRGWQRRLTVLSLPFDSRIMRERRSFFMHTKKESLSSYLKQPHTKSMLDRLNEFRQKRDVITTDKDQREQRENLLKGSRHSQPFCRTFDMAEER